MRILEFNAIDPIVAPLHLTSSPPLVVTMKIALAFSLVASAAAFSPVRATLIAA